MATTAHAFDRGLLPSPRVFYETELGPLTRPNSRGWSQANCCFHNSKSKRSFSVNVQTGAFCCHGCGLKGDIVTFVRLRDNCDFPTACKQLGAWRDVTETERRKFDEQAAARTREHDLAVEVQVRERAQRLALRNEIHTLVEIQADVSSRLSELLQGGAPAYDNEVEDCWGVLSLALDDLRLTESEYMRTCGLSEVSA